MELEAGESGGGGAGGSGRFGGDFEEGLEGGDAFVVGGGEGSEDGGSAGGDGGEEAGFGAGGEAEVEEQEGEAEEAMRLMRGGLRGQAIQDREVGERLGVELVFVAGEQAGEIPAGGAGFGDPGGDEAFQAQLAEGGGERAGEAGGVGDGGEVAEGAFGAAGIDGAGGDGFEAQAAEGREAACVDSVCGEGGGEASQGEAVDAEEAAAGGSGGADEIGGGGAGGGEDQTARIGGGGAEMFGGPVQPLVIGEGGDDAAGGHGWGVESSHYMGRAATCFEYNACLYPGELVGERRRGRYVWVLAVLLFTVVVVHPQSTPPFGPPDQTYVYGFNGFARADAPDAPALNLGATFSIEFWMMLDANAPDGQDMGIFSKGVANEGDPFAAYSLTLRGGTRKLSYFQSTGVPGSARGAEIGTALRAGQWHHVAIVSNNLEVSLYLNGQQQARFSAAGPPPANSVPLAFGSGFAGALRQFRIWGRALGAAEIASWGARLLSGSEPGLIGDWPFDDGQGETVRDLGPNRLALRLTKTYGLDTIAFPVWNRTKIADGGPYFRVQRRIVPQTVIQQPGVSTVPIDFDSDGKVDLLVCQAYLPAAQPCAAFRNDGQGSFTEVTSRVLGPDPPRIENGARDFAVADFNGDGRADVVIANTGECLGCTVWGGQSHLLLQTPDGRLEDATAAAGLPQRPIFTHNVAAGDVDGDGDVDIYYQNLAPDPPVIYLNDGRGHFTEGEPSRLPASIRFPQAANITARFIDVTHTGRLDLVVGRNHSSNQARDLLLLNDGRGFFTPAPDTALPPRYGGANWGTTCIRAADVDGDGWQDLITCPYGTNYAEGAVQMLLNNHDGTFRDATELILQPAWLRHGSLFSDGTVYVDPVFPADFNGDGFLDLLVQGDNQPSRLFLNTGPAGGGRLVEVTELLPDSANHFAVADFNGDGSPDMAAWTDECCQRSLTLETWLSVKRFTLTPDLMPPLPDGPFFLRGSVLNAASFSADALAPGQLVTIFGRNLGPPTLALASVEGGAYPKELSGTRVRFNRAAAPILYTSAGAVTTMVPFSVAPQTRAEVAVEYQGKLSPPVSIYVAASAPGLFTLDSSGRGPAAVLNLDSATGAVSVNTPQNPAQRGGLIVAYLTGAGQTDPPSSDGVVAAGIGQMKLPVEAGLDFLSASQGFGSTRCASDPGCKPVEVLYAGPAPGIVAGVIQVNLRLPDSPSASGTHSLGISVGGIWSQLYATVAIR